MSEVIDIDPKCIVRPNQIRTEFSDATLEELKTTIAAVGIIQPLLLRQDGDRLILLDGERRLMCALALQLPTVPAIVKKQALKEMDVIQQQLITNIHRDQLGPLESAKAIRRLIELTGFSAAGISKLIGKSQATISKLLSLLELPKERQQQIVTGNLGLKAAYEMKQKLQASEVRQSKARLQKLTFVFENNRTMVVTGIESTLDAFIELLDEATRKARNALKQGIELPTLATILRDQSK